MILALVFFVCYVSDKVVSFSDSFSMLLTSKNTKYASKSSKWIQENVSSGSLKNLF